MLFSHQTPPICSIKILLTASSELPLFKKKNNGSYFFSLLIILASAQFAPGESPTSPNIKSSKHISSRRR